MITIQSHWSHGLHKVNVLPWVCWTPILCGTFPMTLCDPLMFTAAAGLHSLCHCRLFASWDTLWHIDCRSLWGIGWIGVSFCWHKSDVITSHWFGPTRNLFSTSKFDKDKSKTSYLALSSQENLRCITTANTYLPPKNYTSYHVKKHHNGDREHGGEEILTCRAPHARLGSQHFVIWRRCVKLERYCR